MGGGFHGYDVLILAFLLTSYVQNPSTANLCGRPIFAVGSVVGRANEGEENLDPSYTRKTFRYFLSSPILLLAA